MIYKHVLLRIKILLKSPTAATVILLAILHNLVGFLNLGIIQSIL